MVSWLRRLLAPELIPIREDLDRLLKQVGALQAERLELVTEWVKTRDQVLRYMKRAGALRQRIALADPEDDEDEDLSEQVDMIRAKYGV